MAMVPAAADADKKTRLGLGALGVALLLGALGDWLLRGTPWGLNVALWTLALVVATAALARWGGVGVAGEGRPLVLPLLLFAAAWAWRDSPTLKALNGLAALAALAVVALRARSGRVRAAGLLDYLLGGMIVGVAAAWGILLLVFGDIAWGSLARDRRWYGPARAVGRGLLLALPLVLVFGGLFVAADAVFQGLVGRLFGWDLGALLGHLFAIGALAWIVGGLLHLALLSREWALPDGGAGRPVSLGMVEVGIVLGALDLLFLAFVVVQVRYLFGGAALVATTSALTYADYARRGFFELVIVAALVLPVLLGAHWILRAERPAHARLFRALAGTLVALLFVVMASAVERMRLYVETYGLTELRLYTTAFMGWLALVFLWAVATVLRGRRERFAFGALVAAFLVIALLDAANPDATIARVNAARGVVPAAQFDDRYAASLSADAVPALIAALPTLPEGKRAPVARQLLREWSPPAARDWRAWNWGRWAAWDAVAANRATLEALAGGGEGR